ncbi:hypothetical protein PZA11_003047 [Diplocarpon coronariae]
MPPPTSTHQLVGSGVDGPTYLGQREVGGNLLSIHFGHTIDYIQPVLGFSFGPVPQSVVANRRKHQTVRDAEERVLRENDPLTSDDTIFLDGILPPGIPLSCSLRAGKHLKGFLVSNGAFTCFSFRPFPEHRM